MTRILVTGSRDWTNETVMREALAPYEAGSLVLHGACRGADQMAERIALELGLVPVGYPADWSFHGRAAGPIRNRIMLDQQPDVVFGFLMPGSRGTVDCLEEAERRGLTTRRFFDSEPSTEQEPTR